MVVICGIITIFSINSFRKSIEDDIEKSLRIVASSVNETYTNLYEGDYTKSIDGKIQKGGVALSSNTSLIDGVHGKTGFDVSFIYGDMRVITTIKREAGGKTTGLKIEQELYDSILEGDDIFLTDTEIDVSSYYAYYQPLINSDGTVIGSIEAVTSVDGVKTIIRTQTIKLVLFSAVFFGIGSYTRNASCTQNGNNNERYAVVAEQICRLAEQSNQSASEIEKMIGEIMTISKSMVSFMELVKENMNHQQDKLEDTKTKYKAVSEGVENSLENIESIKKQIDELGGFGTAIQSAVQNLAQISEKNALSADDTMHAAMGMSDTMNDLKVSSMELLGLADKLQKTLVTFKS
jgi:methyl-accepting chemotaxis protein